MPSIYYKNKLKGILINYLDYDAIEKRVNYYNKLDKVVDINKMSYFIPF